ncbi:MAG: hypothetical protein IJM53_02375 [Lachnospiraceae bacterium]|nr:hypothetical protein [Lachnospiraceae bacterium]
MFEGFKLGKTEDDKKQAAIDQIQAEKAELMMMSEKELLIENLMRLKIVETKLDLLQARLDKVSEEIAHIFVNTSE